jgi:beta-glucosidase
VSLEVDPRLVAEFDERGRGWRIERGSYEVGIGSDAHAMSLTGSAVLNRERLKP